jgi:hypothetical protein
MGLLELFKSAWNRTAATPQLPAATRMGRLISECRTSFDRVRRSTHTNGSTDSELLRRYGAVVWGVVVEVCNNVAELDAAVVLVYSIDDAFLPDPTALVDIARWVKSLKEFGTSDLRAQSIAAMLRCDWQPGVCVSVALDLVEGHEVYVATAAWRRSGLPGGRLVDVVLPVVVMPEATGAAGVLPVACWAGELAGEWLSAAGPETRGVERRAEPREAPAWSAEEVLARYRARPLRVTASAAEAMRAQLDVQGFGPGGCVKVSPVGQEVSVSYASRATGGMEITRCEGLLLAVIARREHLVALGATEIDYKEGAFVCRRS